MALGTHLILFDGVCALCHWTVRFVLDHDRRQLFDFAPLESTIGRTVIERLDPRPPGLDTVVVVPDYRTSSGTPLSKGRAAVWVASRLDPPWNWLAVLEIVPTIVLDWLYDIVARHRYRTFGRYEACPVPRPEHRSRFVG